MKNILLGVFLALLSFGISSCGDSEPDPPAPGVLQLSSAKIGDVELRAGTATEEVPVGKTLILRFSGAVDQAQLTDHVAFVASGKGPYTLTASFIDEGKTAVIEIDPDLSHFTDYKLNIDRFENPDGEVFSGVSFDFRTLPDVLQLTSITIDGADFTQSPPLRDQDFLPEIVAVFSHPLVPGTNFRNYITLTRRGIPTELEYTLSPDARTLTVKPVQPLAYLAPHRFNIFQSLPASDNREFGGFNNRFFTQLDSTYKFPELPDDQLLDLVQRQTFRYFWEDAHPESGMARERNSSGDIVTAGGSGFGLMAIVAAIDRNFISRQAGIERLDKILTFLEKADRFHGAWPHWMDGRTGKVIPFSTKDNGGDLVETAFLVQGLLTFRQYLSPAAPAEQGLIDRINTLWEGVEWTWYTRGGQNVLFWHWSPNYGWDMNMRISGYNEALIVYVLAAASPTYPITRAVYDQGWARSGGMVNGRSFYGIRLPLGYDYGGPLFFAHYSFLGLDPRNLEDAYAKYWEQNVNHALINWEYCRDNPRNFAGYSEVCWGLTASDNPTGYSAHSPTNDLGVITPTAAVASLPFVPAQSMEAIRHFYYLLGDRLWGENGFYDAFSPEVDWYADSFLAIDQGPIVVMLENYRSGLLWDRFMTAPEIAPGLDLLGFTSY